MLNNIALDSSEEKFNLKLDRHSKSFNFANLQQFLEFHTSDKPFVMRELVGRKASREILHHFWEVTCGQNLRFI